LESLASSDVLVAQQLQEALTDAMARLQTQILTLGRTTAKAKVGSFLLSMAERLSADPTDAVLLPISREDIADYLALSVETVSRSLTQLKRCGVIRLLGMRRIKIVDREAIEGLDRFTPTRIEDFRMGGSMRDQNRCARAVSDQVDPIAQRIDKLSNTADRPNSRDRKAEEIQYDCDPCRSPSDHRGCDCQSARPQSRNQRHGL
jgi:hypothetical protein